MKYIAIINGGFAFKSYEYKSEGIRIIRISDFNNDSFINKSIVRVKEDAKFEPYVINNNDILMCMTGGTVGKSLHVKQLTEKMYTNQRVADIKINLLLDSDYLYNYLISPYIKEIINISKNSTNDNISMDTINNFIIAIPPYAEQRRIIDKLDLINSLIIEYSGKYLKLRLLNDNYKENLKKSILQYAIQGKLVEQNDSDEPAPKLIERILDEKRKLMKEKKIKKENLSIIYKDSSDNQFYEKFDDGSVVKLQSSEYDIPNNWCLARISQISSIVTKQTGFDYSKHIKPNLVTIKKENNLPMIQTKNFKGELFNLNTDYYIPIDIAKNFPKILLDSKCLLLSIVGASIGNIGIFSNKELCFLGGAICKVKLINEEMYKYLYYFLQSPQGYKEIMKNYKSTAQGTITVQDVRDIIIPMPPAKEQQRIVAKIDELFSLL